MSSMYSRVQNAVYNVGDRTHQVFGLGKGVYNFLDSVVRDLEFKLLALLLTIKPVSPIFALKQNSCLPFNS